MAGKVRIGCSGWSYLSWRPAFYPARTPQKKLLENYAARLNAVEVNYTFRTLPTATMVANWLTQTPATFRFCTKAPQRITHMQRLRGAGETTAAFAQSIAPLTEAKRSGPALFQLPPRFRADAGLLDAFLAETAPLGLATAWEFRDPSWFAADIYAVLARHGASLCVAESDELQTPEVHTAPRLATYRLRRSDYTADTIDALAKHFTELASGGADVYAFFKHEEKPDGALRALDLLGRIPAELRG